MSDEKGVLQYDNVKKTLEGVETNFTPRAPDATLVRNSKIYLERIHTGEYKFWGYLDELLRAKDLVRPDNTIVDESPWIEDSEPIDANVTGMYRADRPKIHCGPIASANTLLRDPKVRDDLKKLFKAKAVEMESSGVADAAWLEGRYFFVVRGICDYANPNKNDIWQGYAAASAAAFARELIEETLSDDD